MQSEKVRLLHFADSPKWGCGANVRFENGEPCMLSIAQSGIRVTKSRFGLLGAVLYNEKNAYINAQRTGALAYVFPDKQFPNEISSPNLRAFLNAILHCDSAAEVCRTLNEAIELAERKAGCALDEIPGSDLPLWARPESTPTKPTTADVPDILGKFGALMEKYPTAYMDETWLPVNKDQMRLVFKAAWKMAPNAQLRNHIEVGVLFLSHFQPGIGSVPFDFKVSKVDLSPESMARLDWYVQLQNVALAEAEKDSAAMDEFINGQR